MSLATEYLAAQDVTFAQRCQIAAVFYAVNTVMNEVADTTNHSNRAIFAKNVVTTPRYWGPLLSEGVIALNTSSDGSALSDQTVNDSIATIWNMYAGVI